MLRSDAKPLSYLELESFLENIERENAGTAREPLAAAEPKPVAQPELKYCPHCNSRLSAIDNKFGLCMTCNKPLAAAQSSEDQARRRPVSIGI